MEEGSGGGGTSTSSPHPNLPPRWEEGDLKSPYLPQSAGKGEEMWVKMSSQESEHKAMTHQYQCSR